MNDEELIRLLKSEVGPTPDWMHRAADVAWATRDFEAQLAELTDDSRTATGARSMTTHEHALTFAAGTNEIVVSVRSSNNHVDSLSVWLEADDDEATMITLETVAGGSVVNVGSQSVTGDSIATFASPFGRPLRLTVSTAKARFATSWFYPNDPQPDSID